MSYKTTKNKLDKIFAEYIRLRDNRCVICGSINNLNCGHYFSRKALGTRWDEINCNCQCASCNMKHNDNPEPYRKFMVKKYGEKKIEFLEFKYLQKQKYKEYELKDLIEIYKRKIKTIKEE